MEINTDRELAMLCAVFPIDLDIMKETPGYMKAPNKDIWELRCHIQFDSEVFNFNIKIFVCC